MVLDFYLTVSVTTHRRSGEHGVYCMALLNFPGLARVHTSHDICQEEEEEEEEEGQGGKWGQGPSPFCLSLDLLEEKRKWERLLGSRMVSLLRRTTN